MSTEPVNLAGYNLKEWSLIILWIALGVVFGTFGIGLVIAIFTSPTITITGEIDLSQFTAIIIAIAFIAVTMIQQKLTAQSTLATMQATDKSWIESEKNEKSGPQKPGSTTS